MASVLSVNVFVCVCKCFVCVLQCCIWKLYNSGLRLFNFLTFIFYSFLRFNQIQEYIFPLPDSIPSPTSYRQPASCLLSAIV